MITSAQAASLTDSPPTLARAMPNAPSPLTPVVESIDPNGPADDTPPPSPLEIVFNRPAWAHMAPFGEIPSKVVARDDYDPFSQEPTGQSFALILYKQGKARRVCVSRQSNGLYRCWAEPSNTKVGSRYISVQGVADLTVAQVGQFLAEVVE